MWYIRKSAPVTFTRLECSHNGTQTHMPTCALQSTVIMGYTLHDALQMELLLPLKHEVTLYNYISLEVNIISKRLINDYMLRIIEKNHVHML